MQKWWKQMLAVMMLGVLMPRVMLAIGIGAAQEPASEEQTEPGTTEQTQHEETVNSIYIPVLTGQGNVTVMELEDYVKGVVLAEMPASFEEEALKAQAVVARTYAMRRLTEADRHSDGAICTDPSCCQAYISEEEYLQNRGGPDSAGKIARAVEGTAGLVLTYEGELIEATYFSCSGGRTEDAAAVWGTDVPYLQAVDSPGEEEAAVYWAQISFSAGEFAARLGRTLTGTPQSWLGKVMYTDGGGVDAMVIGGITYSGTQLRKLLGLNSTAFTMTADNNGITVETLGRGHRVGMSQYGADAMAVTGSSYEEILSYYYQGTRIDKLSALG